jgi:hypothetical protein
VNKRSNLFVSAAVATLTIGCVVLYGPEIPGATGVSASVPAATARGSDLHVLPATHLVGGPAFRSEQTPTGTYNWSGYVDSKTTASKTFSAVSAQWVQPPVNCPTDEDQEAIFWVGLDGDTDSTVEQDGTMAVCNLGTPSYYTWWEMYPTSQIKVVGEINAGDSISASVTYVAGKYNLAVTDTSTPSASFEKTKKCGVGLTCERSSAEWIVEAPGGSRGYYPLPDFNSWNATAAAVTGVTASGGITTFPDTAIDMVSDAGYDLATVGPLSSDGTSFTDTWDNSY